MRKGKPTPPYPDRIRRPQGAFGWLEAHLLHEHWLARLGPHATAVLVLLALAADRHGASFFSRARMAAALGMDCAAVDSELERLLELQLVDMRPWKPGCRDGVWQLRSTTVEESPRTAQTMSIATILRSLGVSS